jgi:hypothetical protein
MGLLSCKAICCWKFAWLIIKSFICRVSSSMAGLLVVVSLSSSITTFVDLTFSFFFLSRFAFRFFLYRSSSESLLSELLSSEGNFLLLNTHRFTLQEFLCDSGNNILCLSLNEIAISSKSQMKVGCYPISPIAIHLILAIHPLCILN